MMVFGFVLLWEYALFYLGYYFLTSYFAVITCIVWAILLIKDMHFSADKAFEKYLLKK